MLAIKNKDVDVVDEGWVKCGPLAAPSRLISFSIAINKKCNWSTERNLATLLPIRMFRNCN